MTILAKSALLRVGIQPTRGAPAPPAAIRTVQAIDISFDPVHANRIIERMNSTGTFGADSSMHGGNMGAVSFSWHVHAGMVGVSAEAPFSRERDLYEMASMVAAAVPGNNAANYNLTSSVDDMKFGEIEMYFGGRKRVLQDCVCSALSFTFNSGEVMMATATFVGRFISDEDAPTPSGLALNVIKPFVCKNANVSMGGVTSYVVKSLTLNMGLATPDRSDITHESSYAAPVITNRLIKCNVVIEKETVAVVDWKQKVADSEVVPLLYSQAAPNFLLSIPFGIVESHSDGDDEGVLTDELEIQASRSAGNDEMQLQIGVGV